MKNSTSKQRGEVAYQHKKDILTKFWNRCPRLQQKITLEKWLEQIKAVNSRG
jgi:hypothetical protein